MVPTEPDVFDLNAHCTHTILSIMYNPKNFVRCSKLTFDFDELTFLTILHYHRMPLLVLRDAPLSVFSFLVPTCLFVPCLYRLMKLNGVVKC